MQNFTEEQKEELAELAEQGFVSYFVAYDPTTVDGDPEADAVAAGYEEFYREDTANLVEVIYTRYPGLALSLDLELSGLDLGGGEEFVYSNGGTLFGSPLQVIQSTGLFDRFEIVTVQDSDAIALLEVLSGMTLVIETASDPVTLNGSDGSRSGNSILWNTQPWTVADDADQTRNIKFFITPTPLT